MDAAVAGHPHRAGDVPVAEVELRLEVVRQADAVQVDVDGLAAVERVPEELELPG